jgi:hypothetical protein
LQVLQAKETLLQTQTRLLHDALERKNLRQHSELVLAHNPLFKDDENDDVNLDQQPVQQQLSETTPDSSTYKVQLSLSKWIIRPWEEIRNNKHRTGIGYEKDVTFHIHDYTKLIQFQSVGLLQDGSHSPTPFQEQFQKCQHCQRVGHMEDQCFDLHPCEHCGQQNHPSNRCSNMKKSARVKNHYGWIPSWRWPSITKKISQSYRRIHSRVMTHLAVEIFLSSEDITFQLLANLGNVLGTIEPRARFQSLWSSLNHQIGLWSSLNHCNHLVEDIGLYYPFSLWSSQNHQIQRAHSAIGS